MLMLSHSSAVAALISGSSEPIAAHPMHNVEGFRPFFIRKSAASDNVMNLFSYGLRSRRKSVLRPAFLFLINVYFKHWKWGIKSLE